MTDLKGGRRAQLEAWRGRYIVASGICGSVLVVGAIMLVAWV